MTFSPPRDIFISMQRGPGDGVPTLKGKVMNPMGVLSLGRVVATNAAHMEAERLEIDLIDMVRRHHTGDWGDVCQEDRDANTMALVTGGRILSLYVFRGIRFYVITDDPRDFTTVLLSDEY